MTCTADDIAAAYSIIKCARTPVTIERLRAYLLGADATCVIAHCVMHEIVFPADSSGDPGYRLTPDAARHLPEARACTSD